MSKVDGRVAVITGGAGGIGLACAAKLADEGAVVAIADLNFEKAVEQAALLEGDVFAVHLDARDSGSSNALAAFVLDRVGRVDILVNNVGMNIGARHTADVTDAEFDFLMAVNVRGVFMTIRAFLPAMVEREGGSIINMSSVVGQKGVPMVAAYSASKFAVVGMTQSLAAELAPHDITVNSVHPGIVATDLHENVVREFSALRGISFEEAWKFYLELIPLGRLQTSDDVADMVAFLASSKARNITGSAFNVDGGMLLG